MAAAGALTACGAGTNDSFETNGTATMSGGGASATTLATTTSSLGDTPLANATFTLLSPATQSQAPYTLGYAFKQGDVPAGSSVTADAGTLQVIPKNVWPDGSLKFALLSGQVDLSANTVKTIKLSRAAAPAAAAPLDVMRLRFTNAVVEITAEGIGTARWALGDWYAPFTQWASGPIMSSWIYRKPIGTDKHLVAWLEVRLYKNGAVEVLPWIENGYLRVAAPTNKNTRYSFTLGKTQRFSANIDLKHHQRTPLISGTALSYWLANDPLVTPAHNKAYLQATELVPTYMAKVPNTSTAVQNLVTGYQPLQAGNFIYDQDNMASSGYQDPIGLLPQHDVLYLTSDAAQAYAAVVRNGFSAGRWGIHYRDETTNRPLRFSSYPTLNIGNGQGFRDNGGSTTNSYTPTPTGGNPPQWDVAHSPSVGYLAYLVTGRWYFMEEVQFAATANYLGNGDNQYLRTGSKGLVQTAPGAWQTRSAAWDWRAKVQALSVTPDADTLLRSEFIASVEANIEHFHGRYVAQPNNPFGWIVPGEIYSNSNELGAGAPWQQDFVTATFGYAVSLGLPVSSTARTKLAAFFQWKAKSAVMRLGTKSGFWYINATPYVMTISNTSVPDFATGKGPWLADDAAAYAATPKAAWFGSTEGVLTGESGPTDWVKSMWGNLMPAISYAVRHGVPGAAEAYNRMVSASNWAAMRDAFNARPVWSVQPASMTVAAAPVVVPPPTTTTSGTPAWLAGAAVGQWVEIANTAGAGGANTAFSGFAYREDTNEILFAAAGGHGDSADNRVVSLVLTADAPAWKLRSAPSSLIARDVAYYPDGKPTSRHLYSSVHFVPEVNRLMLFGIKGAYGSAWDFPTVDGFNLDTNTWDAPGTWGNMIPGHLGVVKVRATGEVWSSQLARWSPKTKTWSQPIVTRTSDMIRAPIAHDSLRNQLFTLNWGDGQGFDPQKLFASIVPCNGSVQTSIKFNASTALSSLEAERPSYAGMDYDVSNDRFLFYCGQGVGAKVYVVKPNAGTTWDVSILSTTGKVPPATRTDGVHTRFRYVPALKGFVLLPNSDSNLFFIRTA